MEGLEGADKGDMECVCTCECVCECVCVRAYMTFFGIHIEFQCHSLGAYKVHPNFPVCQICRMQHYSQLKAPGFLLLHSAVLILGGEFSQQAKSTNWKVSFMCFCFISHFSLALSSPVKMLSWRPPLAKTQKVIG